MSKTFTVEDVAKHNQKASDGMYIIVDGTVYDVTNFVDEHPGGAKILKRVAGKDASKQFWKVGTGTVWMWSYVFANRYPSRHSITTSQY